MDIQIRNQCPGQKIKITPLKNILKQAMAYMGCKDEEVSVLLVDDEEIHKLNLQYRHKDSPTDVLAFNQIDENTPAFAQTLLGDIVISIPTAQRQAQERGHTLEKELKILLIHGLLHLLGYDHIEDAEAKLMQKKESELLVYVY